MGCSNAARQEEVQRRFEARARRDYVGQQQSWNYVRRLLESYVGLAPRATCSDWVVHFTGPSGSGKSFLAEIIADAAFEPWEEEPYPRASTAAATAGCALVGWMGMFLGPVGASVGCTAGAYGATAIIDAAQHAITPLQSVFRAPRSFPAQCGVRQHHFGRNSGLAEVEAWEYSVAAELLRDPAAVLVLDDVGRLNDAAAFDHLGRLLCGVGGNSVPEFRTGPTRPELVPASHALFVLTSDLELDASDGAIGCELGTSFEEMLDRVSAQSARFWSERALAPPDWWGRFPIVPFRELCPDELSAAVHKYVNRQCDLARRRVEADLERRRSWAIGAAQEYRWVGEARARSRRDLGDGLPARCDRPPRTAQVRYSARSLNVLDAYTAENVATKKLAGGRGQGAWVIADFDQRVVRQALQALTAPDADGETTVTAGGHRREVSRLNSSTYTYTTDVCFDIREVGAGAGMLGGTPQARFERMQHMCT